MWLATPSRLFYGKDELVKWGQRHLELDNLYAENLANDAYLIPKRINDSIWQAFHRERALIFDDKGDLIK